MSGMQGEEAVTEPVGTDSARAEAERRGGGIASPGRKISYREGFVAGAEWARAEERAARASLEAALTHWIRLRERLYDSNWSYDRHLNEAEERVIAAFKAAPVPEDGTGGAE